MSIEHVDAAVALSPEIKGAARMVAFVLARRARSLNDEKYPGACWPGLETIRREAGISQERTAVLAIRALEDAGLVKVTTNGAPSQFMNRGGRSNLYELVGALDPAGGEQTGGRSTQGGLAHRRGGSERETGGRSTHRRGGSERETGGRSTHRRGGSERETQGGQAPPESEVEPEREPEGESQSSSSSAASPADPSGEEEEDLAGKACMLVAKRRLQRRPTDLGQVNDPVAWCRSAAERLRRDHDAELSALAASGAPVEAMLDLLDPPPLSAAERMSREQLPPAFELDENGEAVRLPPSSTAGRSSPALAALDEWRRRADAAQAANGSPEGHVSPQKKAAQNNGARP